MTKNIVIAIDGPAGSGKSTIARLVAQNLKIFYIDSGAIYRAYTLQYLKEGIRPEDHDAITELLKRTKIDFENQDNATQIFVNDENVSEQIRSLKVTENVSVFSKLQAIREVVTQRLRSFAKQGCIVIEGRDIGTVVFPDADLKIFVTASVEERARRRNKDFKASGIDTALERIKSDLQKRDRQDSERALAPLQKAEDAILLDTTGQSIMESVEFVVQKAEEILKSKLNN